MSFPREKAFINIRFNFAGDLVIERPDAMANLDKGIGRITARKMTQHNKYRAPSTIRSVDPTYFLPSKRIRFSLFLFMYSLGLTRTKNNTRYLLISFGDSSE